MATTIKTTFQLRRGNAEVWAKNNPILAAGEPGFELDTGKLKIGNGNDTYNDLSYIDSRLFTFTITPTNGPGSQMLSATRAEMLAALDAGKTLLGYWTETRTILETTDTIKHEFRLESVSGTGVDRGMAFVNYEQFYKSTLYVNGNDTVSFVNKEQLPNPTTKTEAMTQSVGMDDDGRLWTEPGASSGGGVQPDWNQNDSTAADYVKNRPFYSQHEEGYLIENKSVSIESATEPVYVRGDVAYFPFSVGETYKVTWDGVEYSCTANSIYGEVYIGNANLAGASDDNNEPFLIMYSNGDYVLAGAVGEHNFSISGGIEQITKLPSKFLPPAEDYIPSSYAKTMEIFFSAPIEQLIEAEQHFNANGVLYLAQRLVLGMSGSLSTDDQVTFYTHEAAFTFKSDGTETTEYTLENNVRYNSNGSPNGIILNSKDSSKKFLITVDDTGTLTATEVTETT